MKSAIHQHNGFSLIETLVAISILALVSVSATAIMSNFLSGTNTVGMVTERMAGMMKFREQLSDDLFHAVVRPSGKQEKKSVFDGGFENEDCFLRLTRRASPLAEIDRSRTDIEHVFYCIDEGILERRVYDRPDAIATTRERAYRLISDVTDLDIRFFVNGDWQTEWQTPPHAIYDGSIAQLPDLVEVSWAIQLPDGDDVSSPDQDQRYLHFFRVGYHTEKITGARL